MPAGFSRTRRRRKCRSSNSRRALLQHCRQSLREYWQEKQRDLTRTRVSYVTVCDWLEQLADVKGGDALTRERRRGILLNCSRVGNAAMG